MSEKRKREEVQCYKCREFVQDSFEDCPVCVVDLDGMRKKQVKKLIAKATLHLDDTTNYVAIIGEESFYRHAFVVWMRLEDVEEKSDDKAMQIKAMKALDFLDCEDKDWTVKFHDEMTRSEIQDYIMEHEIVADELAVYHVERDFNSRKFYCSELDMEEVIEEAEALVKKRSAMPGHELKAPTFKEVVRLFGVD